MEFLAIARYLYSRSPDTMDHFALESDLRPNALDGSKESTARNLRFEQAMPSQRDGIAIGFVR